MSKDDIPLEVSSPLDLDRTLRKLVKRSEEAGIRSRELGVLFEDLKVSVKSASSSHQPSLVGFLNPAGLLKAIQMARHSHRRDILLGFEGTVLPGEMLLVLGRPGSGCTTLLKTLANQRSDYDSVLGSMHYDSLAPSNLHKHHRGDVIYCPEDDVHFPTLTVEQTIKFAAKLRAPAARLGVSREEYAEAVTDLLTRVFGLKHARKTLVGDAAIRGVSGGEKKRVSLAEVMALRARVACWDNSTRGLDASTALEFIQALRTATDVARMSTVVSLYQAGESLYNQFDKVCVIYNGRMAYYGPANKARSYFIEMGYEPANRQTTADFLVAVTDPNGRIPRSDALTLPRDAPEFAAYYLKSEVGVANKAEMAKFRSTRVDNLDVIKSYEDSAWSEYANHTSRGSPYMVSLPMQAKAVILRRLQILRGDMLATMIYLASFAFQGFISGLIFMKLPESTDGFFSRGGVLFFALLNQAVISMSEVPSLFGQRPIVQRQSSWAMYRPSIDQVALTLVDLPITFLASLLFGVLLYEMAQLQQSAAQFFIFFLFLFVQSIVTKMYIRAVTALMPDPVGAQAVVGLSVLTYVIYTGYSTPLNSMVGALKWVSYLNPLRWGFEALMSNEFRTISGNCDALVPRGPGYENIAMANQVCTAVGAQPGQAFVDGDTFLALTFTFSWSNTWRNLGIIVAFGLVFFVGLLVFTEIRTRLLEAHDIVLFKWGTEEAVVKHLSTDDLERASQCTASEIPMEKEKAESDTTNPNFKATLHTTSTTDIFSWQGLSYSVPTEDGPRRLMNNVSGYVAPGKLTALMGESGAGKTTLLNVLAQRVDVGVITGDRFVNGQSCPKDFQAQTAYCQQQDTHVGSATVQEALLFSAQLRQPSSVPLSEKIAYVDTCIELCGLGPYRNAAVGSLGIENRKRTTIAVELAAKPKLLLFLDEPTSGLDSQSAWNIVLFLKDLANKGQAILCTIHQPSAELFQLFDRLLLLRKGGETVYFGDLGHQATTVLDYFSRNRGRACAAEENPAEYILDVIGAGATAKVTEDWHTIWRESSEAQHLQVELENIHTEGRDRPPVLTALHTEHATGWGHQVFQLIKRGESSHNRNPSYLISKFLLNAMGGLFIGLSFFDADNSQQGTQNKLFTVYMASIVAVPMATQVQAPFLDLRAVYEIRERPSRMYSWTAFVAAQILVEIPWSMLSSAVFYFCWYWTVGFPNDRAGYSFLMLAVMFPTYYTTIGQAVAAMCPSAEIAGLVFGTLFSFVLSFNGVVQPYSQLGWLRWLYRMTPFTYFVEGLFGQAIGRQDIECAPLEIVTINPPSGQTCIEFMGPYISFAGGYLVNPDDSAACGFCSTRTTDDFLEKRFNIFYDNRWMDIGVMAAFIAFNIAITFAFMWLFRIRTVRLRDMLRGRFRK